MGLNVICFLWGDWPAPGLGPRYVRCLRDGVARNLAAPHRFICFADLKNRHAVQREGIEVWRLNAPSWKGCLPKLYAYSPEAGLVGRTLIFDLDNIVVGDLSGMASWDGDLAVRAWFRGYDRGEKVADGDMISFDAGSPFAQGIWADAQDRAVLAATGGRERYFLRRHDPALWQDILGPRWVLSYKNHLRGKPPPAECRVVSCHDGGGPGGTVRPHQLKEEWVRRHWR